MTARVLLVDDEDDIRLLAGLTLARIGGFDVAQAASGAEAMARARAEPPDLVVLDVMMPGMDGPATLAALRADPVLAAVPIVFLTAKATPSEVQRLLDLGAADVVTKPFDPLELPRRIRSVLERRG